jgi:hypothetical protein
MRLNRFQQLTLRRVHHGLPGHNHGRHGLIPARDRADERRRLGIFPDVHLDVLQPREAQTRAQPHAVLAAGSPVHDHAFAIRLRKRRSGSAPAGQVRNDHPYQIEDRNREERVKDHLSDYKG